VLTAMTLIMEEKDREWYEERYNYTDATFRHGAEVYARVNSGADLLPFAKAVVTGAIRKRVR